MKKPRIYCNEFDPNAAAWIRELMKQGVLPEGDVDERSITDVEPGDLRGYSQHHFFAGIGGWLRALTLAGVPFDLPLCTASLPCQPWSDAGKGEGQEDDRHLYPVFHQLVLAMRWPLIFGEQVASAAVVGPVHKPDRLPVRGAQPEVWYSGIRNELESASYTVGALDLPAPSIGTRCEVGVLRGDTFAWESGRLGPNHIRQRLYWCAFLEDARDLVRGFGLGRPADSRGSQRQGGPVGEPEGDPRQRGGLFVPAYRRSLDERLPDTDGQQCEGCRGEGRRGSESPDHRELEHRERTGLEGHAGNGSDRSQPGRQHPGAQRPIAETGGARDLQLADGNGDRRPQVRIGDSKKELHGTIGNGRVDQDDNFSFWVNSALVYCKDGKARRVAGPQSSIVRLADGFFYEMALVWAELETQASNEIKAYAESTGARPREILPMVQKAHGPLTFQIPAGGSTDLRAEEVLQHFLLGVESACEQSFTSTRERLDRTSPGTKVDGRVLRDLQVQIESLLAPYRRESEEQQAGKPSDALCVLSRFLARCCETGWNLHTRTNAATFPLIERIEGRTILLKGYGNAIVPQLAAEFVQTCMEVIAG